MKTAICYYSRHHGNTRKVLEAMAQGHPTAQELQVARMFYQSTVLGAGQ